VELVVQQVKVSGICAKCEWVNAVVRLHWLAAGYRTWRPASAAVQFNQYFQRTPWDWSGSTHTRIYTALPSISRHWEFTTSAVPTAKVCECVGLR